MQPEEMGPNKIDRHFWILRVVVKRALISVANTIQLSASIGSCFGLMALLLILRDA